MPRNTDEADLQREIGRRIQAARIEAGLTQEDAAAAAGIDSRRWQRLENGTVNPTLRTLSRVCSAVGLTFWALVAPPVPAPGEPSASAGKAKGSAKTLKG